MFKLLPFSEVSRIIHQSIPLQTSIPALLSAYRQSPFTIQDIISEWKGDGGILLAQQNNDLLGLLRLDKRRTYWEVSSFIVDPHYRGQGIGSRMLNTLDLPIYLKVRQENEHAIQLYRKHNFTIETYCEGRYIMKNNVY
jgi:ribosomal protein S18 acetylase RimI-like enzyme